MPTTTFRVSLNHRFDLTDVSDTVDEPIYSPVIQVDRNDVKLSFQLKLAPEQLSEEMLIAFQYVDGPNETIKAQDQLSVIYADRESIIECPKKETKEFKRKGQWAPMTVFPSSLNELENEGYISTDQKFLHVVLQLFVLENIIFASINYKFSVDQNFLDSDPDERIGGSTVSVVHNNVRLVFNLFAIPNASDDKTGDNKGLGLYVEYIEGPKPAIRVKMRMILAKNRKRQIMTNHISTFKINGVGFGKDGLPRTIAKLLADGYLGHDRKSLHVIAEFSIPESAFLLCESSGSMVQVDSLGFYLHQELTSPALTSSHISNRVEFVTNDDTHLWAHKDVLSFASDVFKDLFDPTKPEETKMENLKKGIVEMDDLSGDALRQMMHFIYLRQPDKDFRNSALEIIPVADQFLIKGLMEVCENSLIDQLDTMAIDPLTDCLKASHTFNLTRLRSACVETLSICIKQGPDVDQKLLVDWLALAEKHDHPGLKSACESNLVRKLDDADRTVFLSLLSVARSHQLETLTNHCVRWFRNNFTAFKADGFIDELMDDKSENGRCVIHFLLESVATLPWS